MQFSHSFLEALWNGRCWLKMESHIRNMRGCYDNLRSLIELACLALPSKDAKEFDTGSSSGLLKLRKAVLMQVVHSSRGNKFVRKIEVLKLSSVPGKQQPLLTFTACSAVV